MPYIVTASGEEFDPTAPDIRKIHIRDIAHALSHQCRFSGHCKYFYSVAQHSLLVHYLYSQTVQHNPAKIITDWALWALLHDAAEAYLVDLPRPIKRNTSLGSHYLLLENEIMRAVAARFQLEWPAPDIIWQCDEQALQIEATYLMPKNPAFTPQTNDGPWLVPEEPPARTKESYLSMFSRYYGHFQ